MYLHCKAGFFEVDRWDGTPVPIPQHQLEIDELVAVGAEGIIVVRCRQRAELEDLMRRYSKRQHVIWKSPPGWDYQWRVYLTLAEWCKVMALVGADLDYRNFKAWTTSHAPEQQALAHDIWGAAYRDGNR
jgi:hypothetical protein